MLRYSFMIAGLLLTSALYAQEPTFPPKLPDGKTVVTDQSDVFLKAPDTLLKDVKVAKTAPSIDFAWVPGQDYKGNPWSNWGDSLAVGDKYYLSIGDHLALGGNAFVYEYDPVKKSFRQLLDTKKLLQIPTGHYAPGKIHGRLDMGKDGWIYCSTHRGSTKVTTDEFHFKGDWIVRCDPKSGKSEIVTHAPVSKHCIPTSVLDPDRLIFYGGTAPGVESDPRGVQFIAYDCANKKLLYAGAGGPPRYLAFAPSTGRVYWNASVENGELMRFDPKVGKPEKIAEANKIGIRAATQETKEKVIYTVSQGHDGQPSQMFALHTDTEKFETLGPVAVGTQDYITSLDVDPTGRYVYYIPGAHGGSEQDNTPIVQYDVKTKTRKIIAFLHPFYMDKFGATLRGTFSSALSPDGSKIYVTWNVSRATKVWDSNALTVIHIPASERVP